jgi:hypothetical protein
MIIGVESENKYKTGKLTTRFIGRVKNRNYL